MSRPMAHLLSKLLRKFPAYGLLSGRYKIGIQALLLNQFCMSTALDNMSVV